VQLLGRVLEKAPDIARSLADTLLVFDERDANIALAVSPKPMPGDTAISAFSTSSLENSTLPSVVKGSVLEPMRTSTHEVMEHASPHARSFQPVRRDDAYKSRASP
jgi:hypothetical protein